ncbi:TPA: hypothetical protein ACKP1B_004904 [Serratia fonticola]
MSGVKPPTFMTRKVFKVLGGISLLCLALFILYWAHNDSGYQDLYCSTNINIHRSDKEKHIEKKMDATMYFINNHKVTFSMYGMMHDDRYGSSMISRSLDYEYEVEGKFLLLKNPKVRKGATDNAPDDAIVYGDHITVKIERLSGNDILVTSATTPYFICKRSEK